MASHASKYKPLRSLAEIRADILALEKETDGLLRKAIGVAYSSQLSQFFKSIWSSHPCFLYKFFERMSYYCSGILHYTIFTTHFKFLFDISK